MFWRNLFHSNRYYYTTGNIVCEGEKLKTTFFTNTVVLTLSKISLSLVLATPSQYGPKNMKRKIPEIWNSVMKSQATPHCPAWDMNHPFVQRVHTVYTTCPFVT